MGVIQSFTRAKHSNNNTLAKKKKDKIHEHLLAMQDKTRDILYYLPLLKAANEGDWESAKSFFDDDPNSRTAKVTAGDSTALHLAVRAGVSKSFVQELASLCPEEALEMKDWLGDTPLHCAGIVGNTDAARILVQKNPRPTGILNKSNDYPIHRAAEYGHKDTVSYLLEVTQDEDPSPFAGKIGAKLLNQLIIADFYGMALDLLKRHPKLALGRDYHGRTALETLAQKPHAFESGSQLGWFQRFLYKYISLEKDCVSGGKDVENPTQGPGKVSEKSMKFKFLQEIYDTKLRHVQALELTKIMCSEVVKTTVSEVHHLLRPPMREAATQGIYELVVEVVKAYPYAMSFQSTEGNIFYYAIMNRKERVFSLLHQMTCNKYYAMALADNQGNNMLHLAGKLAPSTRISGAALQMQRELQWFQEVEKAVQPSYRERRNKAQKTPREVFTEEHKELVTKGEEWMKTTAESCTVVAALIVTVVFAAAFTAPGGNASDGYPNFLNDTAFMIFAFSDAFALFSSSTSVLMFLGILTSRYAEEDFLKALPMRLSIGLISLFFSIATMLLAFGTALHLVLAHKVKWIAAPVGLLACVPVTLFAFLQFPLLMKMVSSTFGPSIFRQRSEEIIC